MSYECRRVVTVNTSDVKSSVLYDSSLALLERRLDRRIACRAASRVRRHLTSLSVITESRVRRSVKVASSGSGPSVQKVSGASFSGFRFGFGGGGLEGVVLTHAPRRPLDVEDNGVVHEAVQDGGGHDGVAEDLTRFRQAPVGGDHGGVTPLIAGVDDVEEHPGTAVFDGKKADIVDDEDLWVRSGS